MKSPLPFDPASGVLPEPVILASGKYATLPFPRGVLQDPVNFRTLINVTDDINVYVIGEIIYLDDLKNVRTTGFCREWKQGWISFRPVDNPDYEYAD